PAAGGDNDASLPCRSILPPQGRPPLWPAPPTRMSWMVAVVRLASQSASLEPCPQCQRQGLRGRDRLGAGHDPPGEYSERDLGGDEPDPLDALIQQRVHRPQ